MSSAVIIAGPTASGKTGLSYRFADILGGEIINGDSAQIYFPFMVGTAKPDFYNHHIPHHLFDRMSSPDDYNVLTYRSEVTSLVEDLSAKGKVPIIVGGSLFYFKTLFYPVTQTVTVSPEAEEKLEVIVAKERWAALQKIDPERAESINPNDRYRIDRALLLYFTASRKPSEMKPQLEVPFSTTIVFLNPDRQLLYSRINQRTIEMVTEEGWIEECERIMLQPKWESFARKKNFLGYATLFDWIRAGKQEATLPKVIKNIQKETRHYAKRQVTFWRSLLAQLQSEGRDDIVIREYTSYPYPEDEIVDLLSQRS